MIGSNLSIDIKLKDYPKVSTIEVVMEGLKYFERIVPNTFEYKKEGLETEEVLETAGQWKYSCDKILFDYHGNEYGVPASFYITYYFRDNDFGCEMISISAFNHPAGEILYENSLEFAELVKICLDRLGVFEFLLFSNDTGVTTPELIGNYLRGQDMPGISFTLK